MPVLLTPLPQRFDTPSLPFPGCLSFDDPVCSPRLGPIVREPQKVKGSILCVELVCDLAVSSIFPSSRTLSAGLSFCTRPRLPSGGSLGPHFPTFTGTMLGYDYHLLVSMPCALARSPIPCLFLPFVSFLQARQRSGTLALTPGLLGLPVRLFRLVDKETDGSPKFPGYPFELMPCSQTPVVSSALALACSGLLPSVKIRTSAFPSYI
jgi:hypothetical protein